jgi:hypothetical protein
MELNFVWQKALAYLFPKKMLKKQVLWSQYSLSENPKVFANF